MSNSCKYTPSHLYIIYFFFIYLLRGGDLTKSKKGVLTSFTQNTLCQVSQNTADYSAIFTTQKIKCQRHQIVFILKNPKNPRNHTKITPQYTHSSYTQYTTQIRTWYHFS